MARPLSEEKREALLNAAAELIAAVGIGASTAKIARRAGVSEGTLFTYFPTKGDLVNQLFIAVESELAEAVSGPYANSRDPRVQLNEIWMRLIDWGIQNPVRRRTVRQLKVSNLVMTESREVCGAMFQDARSAVERCLAGRISPDRSDFYIDTVLFGLADITMDAIIVEPSRRDDISAAAFDLFWNGVAQ